MTASTTVVVPSCLAPVTPATASLKVVSLADPSLALQWFVSPCPASCRLGWANYSSQRPWAGVLAHSGDVFSPPSDRQAPVARYTASPTHSWRCIGHPSFFFVLPFNPYLPIPQDGQPGNPVAVVVFWARLPNRKQDRTLAVLGRGQLTPKML